MNTPHTAPSPLRAELPLMTFEGEEELFNRTAATIQPGPLTDWLWSRGDEYAAHHPTRTTRQCQLAACLDYAEARHTAPK